MTVDPDARTHASEARPDPFLGRTVDGYRVEEVIGHGGMGTVYKATQLSLERPVALKLLTPDLARDRQFLERFHREADVLSRLSHPNIVTVFDRGEVEGRPYLAMEYVPGPSLRDVMREGPLPPAEALRIVSSVLSALAHAHDSGVVHRDVKPENVLLARGDVVKVADFGLSRLLGPQETTRLTRTQLVLGTYEYMAPEQREHAREADARSDLYATGVVLYEMLTGELPIGRFALPSQTRPAECDARIDRIVERSLEKNPNDRFQRAGEMADAVSSVLDRAGLEPPPAPPRTRGASYRPVRFEYHIDNVATIDHVLGTVCHVLGFVALFGIGFHRSFFAGIPFFAFFILGWYLRETASGLRKYKRSARTGQAVIAIVGSFVVVLIPFSLYALWALFGHRGRTYYEARGRGLSEQEAARHTYRMLEEPFAEMRPQAPPPPAPRRTAPRPSQIPVESMVTSEVVDKRDVRVVESRFSGFVSAGLAVAILTGLGWATFGVLDETGRALSWRWLAIPGLMSAMLLVIGFFHSLVTPRVKGALVAFLVLLFAVAAGLVLMTGGGL